MSTFADFHVATTAEDFWRTPNTAGSLPDGTTDVTEAIARTGLTGVGSFAAAPVAQLDVAFGARSGVDGRVAGVTPLYVTGVLPPMPLVGPVGGAYVTPVGGAELRHSNQTQGIGISYNGIYATGSIVNQDFTFLQKGGGQYAFQWQAKSTFNVDYLNFESPVPVAAASGFDFRFWQAGVTYSEYFPCYFETIGPISSRQQWNITVNGALINGTMFLRPINDGVRTAGAELYLSNSIHSRKIVLFETSATPFGAFGFGIEPSTLLFNVPTVGNRFRWAQAGVTGMILNNAGVNGRLNLPVLQTFATDAAAGAGGLVKGDVYIDAGGTMHGKL